MGRANAHSHLVPKECYSETRRWQTGGPGTMVALGLLLNASSAIPHLHHSFQVLDAVTEVCWVRVVRCVGRTKRERRAVRVREVKGC
jgi:hypothetical protein